MVVTTTRISSLLHCTHTFPQHHRDTIITTTTTTLNSRRRKGSLRVSMAAVKEVMVVMEEEEKKKLQLEDQSKWPKSVVDVGCGIGGSSRYLAKKFGANCVGITLSPVQAERANALAAAQGLADKVSFQVADALQQPFPDGQFDLVWSMESGEHMPNKPKFVGELARVAAPGGTIIIVTWCHRDLRPDEESLQQWEKDLLKKICDSFYLPEWCSTADYVKLLETMSLQDIKSADWSPFVAPFWPAVIRSALTWKGFTSILRSGLKTIKGALAMPLMIEGFRKGVIKFAIITCRKPENADGQ
ncbi:gamma-tocopherol methyltransferase [Medicago truncatula]|nr:gamma-tocopherol methyltransferase [Medicago truncatula]